MWFSDIMGLKNISDISANNVSMKIEEATPGKFL